MLTNIYIFGTFLARLSFTTDNFVKKPKFKGSHFEKYKAKTVWERKEKCRLRPNVLVLKLGGLSRNQRIENFGLSLLTDQQVDPCTLLDRV